MVEGDACCGGADIGGLVRRRYFVVAAFCVSVAPRLLLSVSLYRYTLALCVCLLAFPGVCGLERKRAYMEASILPSYWAFELGNTLPLILIWWGYFGNGYINTAFLLALCSCCFVMSLCCVRLMLRLLFGFERQG